MSDSAGKVACSKTTPAISLADLYRQFLGYAAQSVALKGRRFSYKYSLYQGGHCEPCNAFFVIAAKEPSVAVVKPRDSVEQRDLLSLLLNDGLGFFLLRLLIFLVVFLRIITFSHE